MASITFTVGANTKTFTVSAGDATRIISALRVTYDPNSTMTTAQLFDVWATSSMQTLKDLVKRVEGDAAAVTARTAVVDVSAT
jgi:hypothetical protein